MVWGRCLLERLENEQKAQKAHQQQVEMVELR
jgi:hypothetical protein